MGEARFGGQKTLEVRLNGRGTLRLTADKIFINTGTRPSVPPVQGLDDTPFLDNVSIMESAEVPEHLLILGGGYAGLEFGQMFRRLGSRVTIVQRGEQLLAREDADVAEEVAKTLCEDGVEVLLNAEALRTKRGENGKIQVLVRTPEGELALRGSHLLVNEPSGKGIAVASASSTSAFVFFIRSCSEYANRGSSSTAVRRAVCLRRHRW
jgi:pyruvate/2-oxoglutarate dehydrogenase complex dihydrolipoamide dehydrogenase (E3) component